MSSQDRRQASSVQDHVPLTSNIGLIAGLAMAATGFIALFIYYF